MRHWLNVIHPTTVLSLDRDYEILEMKLKKEAGKINNMIVSSVQI